MDRPTPNRWSWKRKLLLQIALLPIALVAVELATRGYLAASGAGWDRDRARADVLALVSSMNEQAPDPYEPVDAAGADVDLEALDQKLLMHPFYGWDKRSSLDTVAADVGRFRDGRHDANFDVMILGGSVAARFARGGEERLKELLLADPRFADRDLHFLNYARGGFKQPQQASELAFLLALGIVPDAVINIDGFNEIALSVRNEELGIHPTYPASAFWSHFARGRFVDPEALDLQVETWSLQREAQRVAADALTDGRLGSAALGTLTLRRLRRLKSSWAESQQAYTARLAGATRDIVIQGPQHGGGMDGMLATTIEAWAQSSRSMRAMCAERGTLYLHVLQPTLADEGSKELTPDEEEFLFGLLAHLETIRAGYDQLRSAGRTLADVGVNFVDATDLFADVSEDRYVDHCHFGPKGNRELAERIATAFLAAR